MRLATKDDPRLKIVYQENIGFTASMNRAIRGSAGQYVAVHGAGDVSHPDRLALQAAYLDANPAVGAVGCRRADNGRATISNDSVKRGPMLDVMLNYNPFSHGEVMFRRSLFDRVGGYREAFRFAQDRDLPALQAGERVALLSAGAYGFVMSSTYNSRPLLPEILVDGNAWTVIRERQTYDDLVRGEVIPALP